MINISWVIIKETTLQYVNVAVNAKTSLSHETFTYLITPEQLPYIKTGVLVSVPFRSKKILGIVISINKFSNLSNLKLRKVDRIIDTRPVINNGQIELARWISSYYLAPIGEVLFMMIPPVAHRLTSKVLEHKNNQLIINKPQNISYSICDRIENRIKVYIKLINKAVIAKKSVLVLFPKIDRTQNIIKELEKQYPKSEIAVLYSNLTVSERYQVWQNVTNGKIKIIVGSRSAVFAPMVNLGLIIVDDPSDFGYKEEQTPKYNAVTVAERISKTNSINLVYGLIYPNSSIANKIELKNNIPIGPCAIIDHLKKIKFLTIDMSNERSFISFKLENKIRDYLDNKKKILLFVNQKGSGSVFICSDCNNIIKCNKCSMPFHYYNDGSELFCPRCKTKEPAPQLCSVCNGTKLKPLGIGTKTVESKIKKIFPFSSIKIVESEKVNKSNNTKISADIVVATSKIFDYLDTNFDLTAVISIDNQLDLPDYNIEENIFISLTKLVSITKDEFIIQTHSMENYIIKNFPNFNQISKHMLHERKTNKYPPYYSIIKLIYKNESEDKCVHETERVYKILNTEFELYSISLFAPNPCFIAKKRNKFYYQIVIKAPLSNSRIKNVISKISSFGNWSIDVDPVNLI